MGKGWKVFLVVVGLTILLYPRPGEILALFAPPGFIWVGAWLINTFLCGNRDNLY